MPDRFLSSEEYDERAHSLYDEGDVEGALDTLKEGIALYPNSADLYVGLGYARLTREEFAWARSAFSRALALDPAHEDAMVGLGEVLLRLGRSDESIELFDRVTGLGFDDDVELMLTIGRALYREGLFARSHDIFSRLAALRPDSGEAVASVGYALHRMGDAVGASRQIRRALRITPDLHEARVYLGHLLYDRGDWQGALREFERVAPTDHWDPLAVWRVIQLRAEFPGTAGRGDLSIEVWEARLEELEHRDDDPIDRLLAELEARYGGEPDWPLQDTGQLELFRSGTTGSWEGRIVAVRTPDGHVFQGSCEDVVRMIREAEGFSHESLAAFMRRLAERWHEAFSVGVPTTSPESFLRGAAAAGIYRVSESSGLDTDPSASDH